MITKLTGVPSWAGVDMRELFRGIFPDVPIFCDNESNCTAIAEMTWGAARGHEDFVVFTLDLGVGGAIVSGGKVLRGVGGGAGEFGHVVLDPTGPLCRCGNRGCVEVYASFRSPLAEAERHFGRPLRIADVAQMAADGEPYCAALVRRAGEIGGHALGIIGSVLVAFAMSESWGGVGYVETMSMGRQVAAQTVGVLVVGLWSAVASAICPMWIGAPKSMSVSSQAKLVSSLAT